MTRKITWFRTLIAIKHNCSVGNWDSYQAAAVPIETIYRAAKLVRLADVNDLLVTDIGPGPNEEIQVDITVRHLDGTPIVVECIIYPTTIKLVMWYKGSAAQFKVCEIIDIIQLLMQLKLILKTN